MSKKAILPLILFLGLSALFLYVLMQMNEGKYNPRDIPTEFIGRQAPDFSLPSLFNPNEKVTPASYRGRAWLLNVWGTWCPECWREHEYLLSLKQRGIPIVSINWRDDAAEAQAMLKRLGNPFVQIGFDPHSEAVMDYGVYGAPETFLIDADGVIRAKHKGALDERAWQEKFAAYFKDQ
jgi:cytochrome c biogenesis protein CcmG/thiol:disulfide interchange protein DsbE